MYTGKISESAILDSLDKIEMTIIDLQEVSYRIQVKNFTEVKKIIKISAERAEIFGVLFLIVIIVMIISVIKHSLSLAEIIKRKNLFISSIHHELANSAQSIVMAADIIEHEILQADLSKEINLISYHGNNILEQTKEVMDYARLEMGENNISCNVFSINESIFNAINDLNKNNDNFFKVVYSTRKVLISTDQYKVFRIVMNLLDNANKYTIRGRIIINVKIIYNILYIRVKDNGIGFNLKKLNFLYKAFNQGAEKETRQGLGLGLTIIKNYVGLLKGRLKVKSEENVGSSFLVCIPITLVKE
jgi:signal transduction histidine kinase